MTVAELEELDRAGLVKVWTKVFRTPVPKGLSKTLMRRFLANKIQMRRHGGLSKKIRLALRQPAEEAPSRTGSPALQPGGRLLREWNGITHVVEVTDDGFMWKDTCFPSLSAIAREITGTHWSGPRFFGLKQAPKP